VAEVIYGTAARFDHPARFSYAHGGKDDCPLPVPLAVYDRTARVLRSALEQAQLDGRERLDALARLDAQARSIERSASGPTFYTLVARERQRLRSMQPRAVGHGGIAAQPRRRSAPSVLHKDSGSHQETGAHKDPGAHRDSRQLSLL
jgi:hypothetical protein